MTKNIFKKMGSFVLKKALCWLCGFLQGIVVSTIVGRLVPALGNNFFLIWMSFVLIVSIIMTVKFLKAKGEIFNKDELVYLEETLIIWELDIVAEAILIAVLLYNFFKAVF